MTLSISIAVHVRTCATCPPKVSHPVRHLDLQLVRGSIGPESCIPIGSSVFAGLTVLTNRQTHTHAHRQTGHATAVSVVIGHIYIASGAMLRYEFVDELEVGLLM